MCGSVGGSVPRQIWPSINQFSLFADERRSHAGIGGAVRDASGVLIDDIDTAPPAGTTVKNPENTIAAVIVAAPAKITALASSGRCPHHCATRLFAIRPLAPLLSPQAPFTISDIAFCGPTAAASRA